MTTQTICDAVKVTSGTLPDPRVRRVTLDWTETGRRRMYCPTPTVRDAENGEPVPHIVRFSIHADPGSVTPLLALVELYADTAGTPLPADASPMFTDAYRDWMARGQPEGEEPAPQMITTNVWCVVAEVAAPPDSGTSGRTPVEVGGWFAWVEDGLADVVRDLVRAGLRPAREAWARSTEPDEFEITLLEPADDFEIARARAILAEHGITNMREDHRRYAHTFIWTRAPNGTDDADRLTNDTRTVLGDLIAYVQVCDYHPTKRTFGDARTIACLEHALACLAPAAETAAP